jgi:hypothetical protein
VAYAPQAERTVPRVPSFSLPGPIMALVAAGIIAILSIGILGLPRPAAPAANPFVVASAHQWEVERLAQLGYLAPDVRSAREWEKQRRQQSGAFN